jgi:hypothetical protein
LPESRKDEFGKDGGSVESARLEMVRHHGAGGYRDTPLLAGTRPELLQKALDLGMDGGTQFHGEGEVVGHGHIDLCLDSQAVQGIEGLLTPSDDVGAPWKEGFGGEARQPFFKWAQRLGRFDNGHPKGMGNEDRERIVDERLDSPAVNECHPGDIDEDIGLLDDERRLRGKHAAPCRSPLAQKLCERRWRNFTDLGQDIKRNQLDVVAVAKLDIWLGVDAEQGGSCLWRVVADAIEQRKHHGFRAAIPFECATQNDSARTHFTILVRNIAL